MGRIQKKVKKSDLYSSFDQIDGRHPFRDIAEDCFVDYPARERKGGTVIFFNYDLGREVGLISEEHPDQMSSELEKKILDTFGLIIINEYDQINEINYPENEIKDNLYMATRYLQLQHPDKKGKTSGDGRSIWNGYIRHRGKIYDISSCGTGATCLSPATNIKNKFFKSGDPTISYGCGYSEVDEGMGTLFFSEILHHNKVETERILAIISYGNNIGITVRIHENFLRPSHFFNHLKQDNLEIVKNMVLYYLERQRENGIWTDIPKQFKKKMEYFLEQEIKIFAKTAARFEDDYIFCWMDWDGDNIMVNGGIIDYGSIRQFGLYHSEYRYDDVERYSTTLSEQKMKARYIVQTFAQMIDFSINGVKRPLKEFSESHAILEFERWFKYYKLKNLAYKIGLNKKQIHYMVENQSELLESFRKVFHHFEATKSVKGVEKVADGINHNAVFCMRDILRELPQHYLAEEKNISCEEFIEIIQSNYACKQDLKLGPSRRHKIAEYQRCYWDIIRAVAKNEKITLKKLLLSVTMRSSIVNKYDRITGDSITHVVNMILKQKPRISADKVYDLLKEFTTYQNLNPDRGRSTERNCKKKNSRLLKNFFKIVQDCREGL